MPYLGLSRRTLGATSVKEWASGSISASSLDDAVPSAGVLENITSQFSSGPSVTISSISADYKVLYLLISANSSVNNSNITMTVNSLNSYERANLQNDTTSTVSSSTTNSASSHNLGSMKGGSGHSYTSYTIFPNANQTDARKWMTTLVSTGSSSNYLVGRYSSVVNSNNARISTITINFSSTSNQMRIDLFGAK